MKNLIGLKFNKLKVVGIDYEKIERRKKEGKQKYIYWLCKCDCGNEKLVSVRSSDLMNNHTKSCGCLQMESAINNGKKTIKHGNEYFIEKDYVYFTAMNSKNNIFNVYIDYDDIKKCKLYNWRIDENMYVISSCGRIHRYLLEVSEDYVVDHINHNTLV